VKALSITSTLAAVLLLASWKATAQTVTLSRGDFSGSLGTQSVNARDDGFYSRSHFEGGFYGAVAGGWYWTENLKTELDFGARTKGKVWISSPTPFGAQTYYPTDKTFSRKTLALGQQYQFLHNAWFHPHLGAGVNLTWERSTLHRAAAFAYDPVTRTSRILSPERTEPAQTDFRVNPFVESGFKAYMTPRTFFRTDLRVAFRSGVDDVVTRFGFGFDF
jgi:outer membrane protein W